MKAVYLFSYYLLYPLMLLLYPMKISGRGNIPSGASIICANHSSAIDPVLLGFAIGPSVFIRFMAKAELFKSRFLSRVIGLYGGFSIDRGKNDINAIRTVMKFINNGETIGIFPEGTRKEEDDLSSGKTGTVRIAAKFKVPVLPVYMSRNKKLFRRIYVNIGEPYYISAEGKSDYSKSAEELMQRIYDLKGSGH
ncbi:MAG: 1-acyl-sn-glycerol-3-phosphate acyltransferase [Oscillospiraceae bacterium]|nr:1-acyl-sn-glycerol-3-phosphate acyltransferase [Oscillospiraceae bacterium]